VRFLAVASSPCHVQSTIGHNRVQPEERATGTD
jgi:hypothetical protein